MFKKPLVITFSLSLIASASVFAATSGQITVVNNCKVTKSSAPLISLTSVNLKNGGIYQEFGRVKYKKSHTFETHIGATYKVGITGYFGVAECSVKSTDHSKVTFSDSKQLIDYCSCSVDS